MLTPKEYKHLRGISKEVYRSWDAQRLAKERRQLMTLRDNMRSRYGLRVPTVQLDVRIELLTELLDKELNGRYTGQRWKDD